jgi:outer membrane immunogenic protein
MKPSNLIVAAAAAVSAMLGIGAASAADLPLKAIPYAAPAPVFSWTGCYVGVHAGAGVLHDQGFRSGAGLTLDMNLDRHGTGGLAGGQLGCNYQTGRLVLGIEGEGFWSGMKIAVDRFGGINGGTLFESGSVKNKWDYDIAARVGIAIDRALVYGKAGWVAAGFDWYAADVNCGFCTVTQGSATLDGLLIGLGLEYAFTNNWTTKFEYDYLGFGSKNVAFRTTCVTNPATCGPSGSVIGTQNVSADKHIFKVGINYLFNAAAPVVAKY